MKLFLAVATKVQFIQNDLTIIKRKMINLTIHDMAWVLSFNFSYKVKKSYREC